MIQFRSILASSSESELVLDLHRKPDKSELEYPCKKRGLEESRYFSWSSMRN